ncbi:unnamed protein product [Ilex paraguariensis]|uniref:Uncharacterized protein n=1 Tax=Ilex paraguariensis TaxID=185542 RepID=A0ABC8RNW5_9AQUA
MGEVKSCVKVHTKLTVVSSTPTGSGKTTISTLDHAMGLHTLHIIFYYWTNPFKDVTGRLTQGGDGNWEVKCNETGVRTLRASVGTTLDEWLRSADASEERDLTVWEDMLDNPSIWSPFRVQVIYVS